MSLILNGLELNANMVWVERHQPQAITQKVYPTLAGGSVVFSKPNLGVRYITLVGKEDQGWLTKAEVDQLVDFASVDLEYSLVLWDTTLMVRFRHFEPPVIEVTPLLPRGLPQEGDYFFGTIKLMSV